MGGVDRGKVRRAVKVYRWLGMGGLEDILGQYVSGETRLEWRGDRRLRIEI